MPRKKQQPPAVSAENEEPSAEQQPEARPPVPPLEVFYCGVCTLPIEYCEFGSRLSKCKEWLKETDEALFEKHYSDEAMQAKVGTLSLEAQSKLEKESAKKEAKADAKEDAALKKKQASQVTIKRIERNKRKFVTSVHGLEAFDVDLKKAAKQFASKFATGASVTKNPQGLDEIVVQGDVSDEILEMIEGGVGILKGIPGDNVKLVEEKKKKSEAS